MKIIGLTKTWGGNEFIEAAIESHYDFVDKFVFVNSNLSWTGESGNTVKPVIESWQKKNDKDNKIIHIDCNVGNQKDQYIIGYDYIRKNLSPDWIFIFDTDEIWDYANLELARKLLEKSIEYNSVCAQIYAYIKSPFYRVIPPEFLRPVVFVRPIFKELLGIRGNLTEPKLNPDNLYFHHFTYVRKKEADVFKKIQTTLSGDREDVPQCQLVNIQKWKKEKWDKMPKVTDFHTTKLCEKSWHKMQVIKLNDLPYHLRDKEIVRNYNEN